MAGKRVGKQPYSVSGLLTTLITEQTDISVLTVHLRETANAIETHSQGRLKLLCACHIQVVLITGVGYSSSHTHAYNS